MTGESIPCDFCLLCPFFFFFLRFNSGSAMGESDDLPQAIYETLSRENMTEYSWTLSGFTLRFRVTLRLNDYSQLCLGFRVP